ncbi:MAG: hypothetical protein WCO49_17580 [Nostocales cyanobacterium ELA608]
MSNYLNNFYTGINNLSTINASSLNTDIISNSEFNTLNNIDISKTIQQQLNDIYNTLGITGPQGHTGVSGPQGFTGNQGESGPQGHTGISGETGPQGHTGISGETGSQGHTGISGETGPQGHTGISGETGPQGHTGISGETGSQGHTGISGETGPQGHTGISGVSGPQGHTGISGPQGFTGSQGPPGETSFITGITYDPINDTTIIDNNLTVTKTLTLNSSTFDSTYYSISQAVPYLTSNTTTISTGTTYLFQNGTYTISSSTYAIGYEPYKSFDNSLSSTFWRSGSNYPQNNNATNGQYTGTQSTYNVFDKLYYLGDYIQVSLPYVFCCTSYNINVSTTLQFLPKIISFFGSNDNNNWYLISRNTNIISSGTISFSNNRSYSYYRFVVEKINVSSNTVTTNFYAEIGNLNLMGIIQGLTIASNNNLTLTGYTMTNGDLQISNNNYLQLFGNIVCNYKIVSPVVLSYINSLTSNCQDQLNGKIGSISIGVVSTLSAGSSAYVTVTNSSGTSSLSFGIPIGNQGLKGDKGDTGNSGASVLGGIIGGVIGGFIGGFVSSASSALMNLLGLGELFGNTGSLSAEQTLQAQIQGINDAIANLNARVSILENKVDYLQTITTYMTTPNPYETKFTSKVLVGSTITLDNSLGNITLSNNLNAGGNVNISRGSTLKIGSSDTYLKINYIPDDGYGLFGNGYATVSSKRSGLLWGEQDLIDIRDDGTVVIHGNLSCSNLVVNGNLKVTGTTTLTNLTVNGYTNIRSFAPPVDTTPTSTEYIEIQSLFNQLIDGFNF